MHHNSDQINEEKILKLGLNSKILEILKQKTLYAQTLSYSPYSKFSVGCCILIENFKEENDAQYTYITGCNVENASFPASTCAERTAFCKAVSMGYRKFKALCLVGGYIQDTDTSDKSQSRSSNNNDNNKNTTTTTNNNNNHHNNNGNSIITPCGVCRQVIREFVDDEFPIIMLNGNGSKYTIKTLKELLPFSFGPNDLHNE